MHKLWRHGLIGHGGQKWWSLRAMKKVSESPPNVLPNKLSYSLSASILLLNALAMALTLTQAGKIDVTVVAVVIDIALAMFLVKNEDRARVFVLIRAAFGLIGSIGLAIFKGIELIPTEAVFSQVSLSVTLIILLAWKTVGWRLAIGIVFAVVYFINMVNILHDRTAM